ncbi:MAG: hypothetical protein ACE5J1_07145 [Nitrospiria bacterium]
MNGGEEEKKLAASAKQLLDDLSENLDRDTLSRLRRVRHRALKTPRKTVPWLVPVTGFAVAVALIAVFIWQRNPMEGAILSGVEDIELLATAETLDFYEDLEFYRWLEEGAGAG